MHPLAKIGFIVATVGAAIVGVANLAGLPPLARLGLMLIMVGAFNFIIGSMAASVTKRNKRRADEGEQ